jgi:hypothetical protein
MIGTRNPTRDTDGLSYRIILIFSMMENAVGKPESTINDVIVTWPSTGFCLSFHRDRVVSFFPVLVIYRMFSVAQGNSGGDSPSP